MKKLVDLATSNPATKKAAGLISLDREGFPIPQTILLSPTTTQDAIQAFVEEWAEWVYLRLVYSDMKYPHYIYQLCRKVDIAESLSHLLKTGTDRGIEDFDLLLQPLLSFRWSGAVLAKSRGCLIEVVCGAPTALFRDGIVRDRYYVNRQGKCLAKEHFAQFEDVRWQNGSWCRTPVEDDAFPLSRYLAELRLPDLECDTLYEIGFTDETTFFLESKRVPPHALPCLNTMTLEHPLVISSGPVNACCKTRDLEYPAFSQIEQIDASEKVLVKHGALLSHLSLEMIRRNIKCILE